MSKKAGGAELRLRGATVRYPGSDREAIAGVDLRIEPGELVVLLGPSGCGKSTLLRTLNRLVPLSEGTIELDGHAIAAIDPVELRRSIGYAIQAVGLFAHMSVAQNVAVVPSLLGWSHERIGARVDALLELVRLDPRRYRDRRPRELSGGEAQRVGVARALAAEPRVLLMDEPFGAVDAIVRTDLQRELASIVERLGTTTLFVTHDVEEALRLADRLVILRDGHLEAQGSVDELLERPSTPYVNTLLRTGDPIYRAYFRHVRAQFRDARR